MIRDLTDADFHAVIDKTRGPCLVAFWAIWSPSCLEMSKVLEKVEKEFARDVLIGKVNVDNETRVVNEFDVTNIPTIVFFRAGKEQERIPGGVSFEYLSRKIEQYRLKKRGEKSKKGRR